MPWPALLARLLVKTGVARLLPGVQRRLEGGADFLRFWSDRLLTSPLAQLERLAVAVRDQTPDVIDLASAAPRFELVSSAGVRVAASQRGWPPPQGLPELRGAVAAKLLADNGVAVSPAEEVLITAGALGAVQVIFDAFVSRGDAVVLPDPVSPLYPLLARTRGARLRWVGTRVDDGRLRLRFDHLGRRLRGARLLVLCSPGNPSGGILSPEDLEQVAWWADRHDVLLLSDEVFERFAYDGPAASVATLSAARPRTLTVGSVSKGHALAHLRVGWVAGHRHLLRACVATAALRCPFVPTLSQLVALTALRTPPEAFDRFRQQLADRRRYAFDRLQAMGLAADWPGGGLGLWAAVPSGWDSGRAFAEALLATRRVRVAAGELFGPAGGRHVRLSLTAADGRLEEGLNRIADLLRSGQAAARRAA